MLDLIPVHIPDIILDPEDGDAILSGSCPDLLAMVYGGEIDRFGRSFTLIAEMPMTDGAEQIALINYDIMDKRYDEQDGSVKSFGVYATVVVLDVDGTPYREITEAFMFTADGDEREYRSSTNEVLTLDDYR